MGVKRARMNLRHPFSNFTYNKPFNENNRINH